MKFEMRAKAIALSTAAITASFTIFFTGCSKDKPKDNVDSRLTIIDEANVAELTAEKDKTGSKSNSDLFRWKAVKDKLDETIADATVSNSDLFRWKTVKAKLDETIGEYTVPGTTDSYNALIIDTAGGADEPKIVIEPKIEQSTEGGNEELNVVENWVGIGEDPELEERLRQQEENRIDYNQDIYDKIGVKVTLTGSNEEQARQYYEACKAAYPSLPWYYTGISAGVDVSSLREEASVDVWSMTHEEVDALINERLAGRDYHDLSLDELYSLLDLAGPTDFGMEILGYFNDLTGRDFNFGGYHILQ